MAYPSTSKSLIERIQHGDNVSWIEFYGKYKEIIAASGKYKGLTPQECEDLVQEVMSAFSKASGNFVFDRANAKFRTYFHSIVTRKIADFFRKRSRNPARPPHEESDDESFVAGGAIDTSFDDFFNRQWQNHLLEEARLILKSKVEQKTYLAFHFYAEKNKSAEAVAASLEMSVDQIYTAKKRCIEHLKKIIGELRQADPEFKITDEI